MARCSSFARCAAAAAWWVAVLFASVMPASASAAPSAWNFEEVLALGEDIPAPAPAGAFLDVFHLRDVDENGTIHLRARIAGSPLRYGYYRLEGDTLLATRVPGDPAPAPVGGVYNILRDADFASSGLVAFIATVTGGSAGSMLFTWAEGNDTSGPFEGQPAPGTGGGVFSSFREVEIDANGKLAFIAWVSGGTASSGVFRVAAGGPVEAVALKGQPAPVGGPYTGFSDLALSDSGDVAFVATDGYEGEGMRVVRVSGGVHTVVALTGDPAPDLPGRTYYPEDTTSEFPGFRSLELGAQGELAFLAALDDCVEWVSIGMGGWPDLAVPDICALFQQDGGTVHHVLGNQAGSGGTPNGVDIESGIGTLVETYSPSRVQLYHDQTLTDVLLDPDVDPGDTHGLEALTAVIGPGGVVVVKARPTGADATYSIWRGVPVVGAPLLAPPGLVVLAVTLAAAAIGALWLRRPCGPIEAPGSHRGARAAR